MLGRPQHLPRCALTGFGDLELKDLLAERTGGLTDPDDAPAAPEHPVSQTGDLWTLGKHRLPNTSPPSPRARARGRETAGNQDRGRPTRSSGGRSTRIERLAGRRLQRLGLSATIGNPDELLAWLARAGVRTFVSHGSLAVDERRQAEAAFASEPDCVIVATSTLELGIDVGDLDRVVQIDAPPSVTAFLQRMGRSGRRAGTSRTACFWPPAMMIS
jgi:hypothetical protein